MAPNTNKPAKVKQEKAPGGRGRGRGRGGGVVAAVIDEQATPAAGILEGSVNSQHLTRVLDALTAIKENSVLCDVKDQAPLAITASQASSTIVPCLKKAVVMSRSCLSNHLCPR